MSKPCLNCPENKVFLYKNINYFPEVGCKGNEYVDKATGLHYYWNGDEYIVLPCCDSPVVTQDTGTIDMEGDGSTEDPLRAFVIISEEEGNILEVNIDGLYVPSGGFTLNHEDTQTVDLEGAGTIENPLTAEVILSDDFNQDIVERADGLYAPGFYIEATKAELDGYILAGTLEEGAMYKVSGIDTDLYGGTTGYFKAIEQNKIDISGIGIFYNPKYDTHPIWERYSTITITLQSNIFTLGETITANNGATATIHDDARGLIIPLTGDWTTATSITGGTSAATATVSGFVANPGYSIGDKVIWGGKVWENQTGAIGTSSDAFTLDNVNWTEVPYDTVDYNLVYDEIKYDYENDWIIYRKDKSNNEVSTSRLTDDFFVYGRPIKAFQWGNDYSDITGKGLHGNHVKDSYFETINLKSNNRVSMNRLEGNSRIYDLYMDNSGFDTNTLIDSHIGDLFLTDAGYHNNTFKDSYSEHCRFYDMLVIDNLFINSSYWIYDRIYGIDYEQNTFSNTSFSSSNFRNCRIKMNNLTNNSSISGNAFTGTFDFGFTASGIYQNTLTVSSITNNRQLTVGTAGSINRNLMSHAGIGSNTLNHGATINYNTITTNGGISSNNLTPAVGSFGGGIEYNHIHFSNINSNTGAIYIHRNTLSSFSAISSNSVLGNADMNISHNTLTGESGITSNTTNGFFPTITYNTLQTGGINGLSIGANIFVRQNTIQNERFNDRFPTLLTTTEEVSDCIVTSNEIIYYIKKNVTGAAGAGAVGALNIQSYVVPTNFFIEEVWSDFRTGITSGGATINLGLETDGVTSGLDNTTGLMSTLNNTITRTICSAFVPATGNRLIVMSVVGAPIGPGTIYIRVKLRNLKRISFP